MAIRLEVQLGKKGLTKELLEDIKKRFENSKVKNIKVSVLKSARINGVKIWVFDAFNLHSSTYGSVCEVYIGGKTFPLIIK